MIAATQRVQRVLRNKTIIVSGMALLIFLAAHAGICLAAEVRKRMISSSSDTLLETTQMIGADLNAQFCRDLELMKSCAAIYGSGTEWAGDETVRTLRLFCNASSFSNAYFFTGTGKGLDSWGKSVRQRAPFDGLPSDPEEADCSPVYRGDSGTLQITFRMPVFREGSLVGTLYADKKLESYQVPLSLRTFDGKGQAFLIWLPDGIRIGQSGTGDSWQSAKGIFELFLDSGNSPDRVSSLQNAMKQGKSGVLPVTVGETPYYMGYQPVSFGSPEYLITMISAKDLREESVNLLTILNVMGGAFLISGFLTVFLLFWLGLGYFRQKTRKYGETILSNISANIDAAFAIYKASSGNAIMASKNFYRKFRIPYYKVLSEPQFLFDYCGISPDNPLRAAFFSQKLDREMKGQYEVTDKKTANHQWVELSLIPADSGQYLVLLRDITERVTMQESLQKALEETRRVSALRQEFLMALSHDIRTPMNGITGMTDIALKNMKNPHKVEHCLKMISASAEHLSGLVSELLDLSHMESAAVTICREEFRLPKLIRTLLSIVVPAAGAKNQRVEVTADQVRNDRLIGDEMHLLQILTNLLCNAVKYTPEGGRITLEIHQENSPDEDRGIFRFVVEDTGIGIPADFLKSIFSPFRRAEDERVTRIQGTGLGLAIVKRLVDLMEGTVSVESRVNLGTRFTVSVPLAFLKRDVCAKRLDQKKILVCDDSPRTAGSILHMIENLGGRGVWVKSAAEAVEQLRRCHEAGQPIDTVAVEESLSEGRALSAIREIRNQPEGRNAFVLLCCHDWSEMEEDAREVGVNGFLRKPAFQWDLCRALNPCKNLSAARQAGCSCRICQQKRLQSGKDLPMAMNNYSGKVVLLAEDHPLNADVLQQLLETVGVSTVLARNGREAVSRFLESPEGRFDLILMDVQMPLMNGYEAARTIRASGRGDSHIPIAAMTANTFPEDIARAREAGMDSHIPKPVTLDRLVKTLEKYFSPGKN